MQKMCDAKHHLLHMGKMVCLCSVCCPRSWGGKVKQKKKAEGCSHSWGVEIEYMASFEKKKMKLEKLCRGGQKILLGFRVSFDVS
jgi:hypothetical protein